MTAIRLVRIGDDVHVDVEYSPGNFATVISERWDGAFCHVVEPDTITRICGNARLDDDIAASSIGQGLNNIRDRGIDAELADLDRELHPRSRR